LKIAAQLYTVRELLRDPGGVGDVLDRLRAIGYTAVEVAGVEPSIAAAFDEALARSGLVACAAHVSVQALQRDLATEAGRCVRWGCRYVVIPSLPAEYHSAAGFERFGREAVGIASALEQFSLELVYHNHDFELTRWGGRSGLERILESSPVMAELDTYWLRFAGADPAEWIRRLPGRMPLVHLKDMTRDRAQTEVGAGELDWAGILEACREAGTRWLVVEQDECAGDPLDSLDLSYRNLSRLLVT